MNFTSPFIICDLNGGDFEPCDVRLHLSYPDPEQSLSLSLCSGQHLQFGPQMSVASPPIAPLWPGAVS